MGANRQEQVRHTANDTGDVFSGIDWKPIMSPESRAGGGEEVSAVQTW